MKMNSKIYPLLSILLLFSLLITDQVLAQTPGIITEWTPNQESDLSHYIIFRDITPGTLVPIDIIQKSESIYEDFNVELGQTYYYKLSAVDSADNVSEPSDELIAIADLINFVGGNQGTIIDEFQLKQNYPNPFNPATTIEYTLPRAGYVKIRIYDVLGREIISLFDGYKDAGNHKLVWEGKDNSGNQVASGLYFYQMLAGNFNAVKKLLLQK